GKPWNLHFSLKRFDYLSCSTEQCLRFSRWLGRGHVLLRQQELIFLALAEILSIMPNQRLSSIVEREQVSGEL
ncbi:MAG: hypothetical protein ACRCZS_23635, partial [Chroococcidiopsis sp.]